MKRTLCMLFLAVISVAGADAYAVEIPELLDVPNTLSKPDQSRIQDQRQGLATRLGELEKNIAVFNGDCASVNKGSEAATNCRSRQGRLQSLLQAYITDAIAFNSRVTFARGKALLLGYAFKIGDRMRAYAYQSLASIKDTSRVLIGVWNAERGSYEKARHLASLSDVNDEALKEMNDILLSLERKQRALLKEEITHTVISGKFNARFFDRYPINFSLSLVRAHTDIKSHDYDAALRQLAVARKMNIESPALANAELYVRQMKASAMEKKSPSSPVLIKHQANMASAYAGWSLGMLLMDADMGAKASKVLSASASTLAREGNIEDSKTVFRLVNAIPEGRGAHGGRLHDSGVYDVTSEADILLDALEYGNKDWNRSLQFLNIAHNAAPNNERIKEAKAHIQALMASQE